MTTSQFKSGLAVVTECYEHWFFLFADFIGRRAFERGNLTCLLKRNDAYSAVD